MNANQPLAGIRVLDLTRNVAGPYASMILADLGATVIKVEHPDRGDDTRHWGPPFLEQESPVFLALNRNKESITLDLAQPEAREIAARLVRTADVLLESFRPGALDKLGYGPEWAQALNPALIYSRITSYGHAGPLRDRPGYDPLMQAFAGLMRVTGEEGRPPVRVGFSVIDMGTGMWAALAILAALYRRRSTGQGERIITSLYETALAWAMVPLATFMVSGEEPRLWGSAMGTVVPNRAFPTRDGYLVISIGNDKLFQRFCLALGHPEWAEDARFRYNPDRVQHRDMLDDLITAITQGWSKGELAERLVREGVPCNPVRTLAEVAADEQAAALGVFQQPPDGPFSSLPLVSLPLITADGRAAVRMAAPGLGQHNVDVLRRLGYAEEEIARLLRSPAMSPGTG